MAILQSRFDAGHFHDALSREQIDDKDTKFEVYSPPAEQLLPVGYLQGEANNPYTILRLMPWTEYPLRDFERGRNAATSVLTGAEIFSVATPGVGKYSDELTDIQVRQLHGAREEGHSSFEAVGKAVAESFIGALKKFKPEEDYLKNRILVVDGYSQGASTAAGVLKRIQPDIVILREMPDQLKSVPMREFLGNFMKHGGDGFDYYAKTNKRLQGDRKDTQMGGALRAVQDFAANLWHYPAGMAGGSLLEDIKVAYQEGTIGKDTLYVVMNGERSEISRTETNQDLAIMLNKQIGATVVHVVVNNGTHSWANDYRENSGSIQEVFEHFHQSA